MSGHIFHNIHIIRSVKRFTVLPEGYQYGIDTYLNGNNNESAELFPEMIG